MAGVSTEFGPSPPTKTKAGTYARSETDVDDKIDDLPSEFSPSATKTQKIDTDTGYGDDTDTRSGTRSPRSVSIYCPRFPIMSTHFGPSPPMKTKADTDARFDTDSDGKLAGESNSFTYGGRRFLSEDEESKEYQRQCELFYYQFRRSEGFVIDWGKFDFPFISRPVAGLPPLDLELSNEQLIHQLTLYALNQHNKEKGTSLEFVGHVDANFMLAKGFVLWITFWARDLSSSNSEAKLYQTKVLKFLDEIEVYIFRPRPTDEEIDSVYVEPPPPFCHGSGGRCSLGRFLEAEMGRI